VEEEEEGVQSKKEGNELMKKRTISKTYVPRANTTGRTMSEIGAQQQRCSN
jgi:hypothetical protein